MASPKPGGISGGRNSHRNVCKNTTRYQKSLIVTNDGCDTCQCSLGALPMSSTYSLVPSPFIPNSFEQSRKGLDKGSCVFRGLH
jgi:hypothetical protein